MREIVRGCAALGVEVLTLYTFSIENWSRPAREVSALMSLLRESLREERDELEANNVRLQVIGRLEDLPAAGAPRHRRDPGAPVATAPACC